MNTRHRTEARSRSRGGDARTRLLTGIPLIERRLELAGIETAVLEGGDGPPLVLLHGPGESAVNWVRVVPGLVTRYRVVAPDLPGHGASGAVDPPLDAGRVLTWLLELVESTCAAPPALVGHVLGGAIAARFAVRYASRIRGLVLVDSLGLARFRPSVRFALGMVGFLARPSERTFGRFMRQCSFDLDGLRDDLGERWDPFVAYNVELARGPGAKAASRLMREVGLPRIPPGDLARIPVPTTLIWGRHDRANRLRIARAASARYGWPLHVIEDCADDPARDRPEAFIAALDRALAAPERSAGAGPA